MAGTGKLILVEPIRPAVLASSAGEASAQNMLTNDPKEVFVASANAARNITFDFGAPVAIDSFYVGYTNATDASMTPYTCTAIDGSGAVQQALAETIRAADCKTVRSGHLMRLAAPVVSRFFMISLSANAGAALQVGIIRLGYSFVAEWDREWGSGRRPIDTGRSTALLSGGFGVQDGARKGAYQWTFGDLTEAELEQLWGVFVRNGTTSPVIVNEWDGSAVGANEKLHYGLFQRLDPWERREPNATKWAMEVEEWI